MPEFKTGEILHDHLLRRVADAYINGDQESFDYASQIFDEIAGPKRAQAIAITALKEYALKTGLYRDQSVSSQVVKSAEFAAPVDLSRFEDLPSRRRSLKGRDAKGHEVAINYSTAKKLYRCNECQKDIPIGLAHAVLGTIQPSKKYNHHHVHLQCIQERVLQRLHDIEIIDPKKVTTTVQNRKGRRLRYDLRRA